MGYETYGLGQGLAKGMNNNQLINAMNTAALIQYRRDQQRLQNRYVDIAQQKTDLAAEEWGMKQQALQMALDEQKLKFDQLKQQTEGKDFVRYFYGALQSGDFSVVNAQMQKLDSIKNLANQAGVISFDPVTSYSDNSLRELGYAEGMNPSEYLVVNKADGTKELINSQGLAALFGMGNYYTKEQIESVFRGQQLSNIQRVGALPATDEGVANGSKILDLQTIAENIYNDKPQGALASVKSDSQTASMRNSAAQDDYYQRSTDMNLPEAMRYQAMRKITNNESQAAAASFNYKQLSSKYNVSSPDALREAISRSNLPNAEKERQLADLDNMVEIIKSKIANIDSPAIRDALKENAKFVAPIFSATKQLSNLLLDANKGDKQAIQKINSSVAKALSYLPDNIMNKKTIEEIEKSSTFTMITAKTLQYVSGLTTNAQDTRNNLNRFGDIKSQNDYAIFVGLRSLLDEFIARPQYFQNYLNPQQYNVLFGGGDVDGMIELRNVIDEKIAKAKGQHIPKNKEVSTTQGSKSTLTPEQDAYLNNLLAGAK